MQSVRARTWWLTGTLLLVLAAGGRATAAGEFPLRDGDTWVMAGDSITAQHLHSNYFEAFCFARYPRLTFRFRNSGVGGDTIPKLMARFDWDVAAWKPTVVSVELGMNDQGGFSVDQYVANMRGLSERIKATGARPVFLTSSPINNGDTSAKLGGNTKLHEFAAALTQLAAEVQAPCADQFHALIDVWGRNKPRESLANVLTALRVTAQDDSLAGVEHLREFLAAQAKNPDKPVSMQGDAVHPGPPGQLMMAAALLKGLGADGFVSTAILDASGKVSEAKRCTIDGVAVQGGNLAFDRLDESIPFPIADEARSVLPLFPAILELSQYHLRVSGLPSERYTLRVDGQTTATLTAQELEASVNLTSFSQGPIAAQGRRVLDAVKAKEQLVSQWRSQAKAATASDAPADAKAQLAAQAVAVEAADAKIREAAQPRKLRFELIAAE